MSNEICTNMPILSVEKTIETLGTSYQTVINSNLSPKVLPSVMLWGPPGVGKSQIIQSVCKEFGVTAENGTYHEFRLSTAVDSSDITGLPVILKKKRVVNGDTVEYGHTTTYSNPRALPFVQYDADGKEIDDDRLHVLFFDEVNRSADPSIMNAIFQILTEYGVMNHKLVKNCVILLAMNPENTGYAVNELCPALVNRMNIQYMKAEVQPWLKWAREEGNVSKIITDFIDATPTELAHDGIITNEGQDKRFPTPRAWVNVDRNLIKEYKFSYKNQGDAMYALQLIAGIVGWQAATKFVSFARTNAEDRPLTGKEVLEYYGNASDMQSKVRELNEDGTRAYDTVKTTTTLNSMKDEFKDRSIKIKDKELKNMLLFLSDIAPENSLSFQTFLLNEVSEDFAQWFFVKLSKSKELMGLWEKVKNGITEAGIGNQATL